MLVGSTAREQEKQIRKLKQFIEANIEPQEDFSFQTLGKLVRTVDNISEAASKLNLGSDKVNAAVFWFYNGNHADEPAFEAIKTGDFDQVVKIWSKLTTTADVTQRNASAFNNLSTFYLSGGLVGTNSQKEILEKAIILKIKFLESDFIKEFIALATDQTFHTSKKDLQLVFLNNVQTEVDERKRLSPKEFIAIITKQTFLAKEEFLKGYVRKPIEQIEKKVEKAKNEREVDKTNAYKIGKILFESSSESLLELKSILEVSSIEFILISDKISNEILQCGIEYFQYYEETDTDPSSNTMDLFCKANILASGNIAKQRCQENTENLKKWIENKPEREKQKLIEADLISLIKILEDFQSRTDTINNARLLVSQSKPKLDSIKSVLGVIDNFYLKLSTRVVEIAQHNIIEEVNEAQNNLEHKIIIDRYGTINKMTAALTNAWAVSTLIGALDMESGFRINHFNTNKEILKGICIQLGVSTSGVSRLVPEINPIKTIKPKLTTNSVIDEEFPNWLKLNFGVVLIFGIVLLIILTKACN